MSNDPCYHTVETTCLDCEGTGHENGSYDGVRCPTCKGRGYLTREKADWERPKPSDADADDLPIT